MILGKIKSRLYRKEIGDDSSYVVIDPTMFVEDVYTDESLDRKVIDEINEINRIIVDMDGFLVDNAPVRSIMGRTGDVKLYADDIGLGLVDNTSDLDKKPSRRFMGYWVPIYQEQIADPYWELSNQIYSYRIHISGYNNSPLINNPHNVKLETGVYWQGRLIRLDPDDFVPLRLLAELIKVHNENPYSHTELRKIANDMMDLADLLKVEVGDKTKESGDNLAKYLKDQIDDHNESTGSHPYISDQIQKMKDSLLILDDPDYENPKYTYRRYFLHESEIVDGQTYLPQNYGSMRYLSTKMLEITRNSVVFTTSRHVPSITLLPSKCEIDIVPTGGDVNAPIKFKINSKPGAFLGMYLKIDPTGKDFNPSVSKNGNVGFSILSSLNRFGYIHAVEDPDGPLNSWTPWDLKIPIPYIQPVVTAATYSKKPLSSAQINSRFPGLRHCCLVFSDNSVGIYYKNYWGKPESMRTWDVTKPETTTTFSVNRSLVGDETRYVQYQPAETTNLISGMNVSNWKIRGEDGSIKSNMSISSVSSITDQTIRTTMASSEDCEMNMQCMEVS